MWFRSRFVGWIFCFGLGIVGCGDDSRYELTPRPKSPRKATNARAEYPDAFTIWGRRQSPDGKAIYQSMKFENGLQVLLISDSELKEFSAALGVSVGFLHEGVGQEFFSDSLIHLPFAASKGSPRPGEWVELLKSQSGKMTADLKPDRSVFSFSLPAEAGVAAYTSALRQFGEAFVSPRIDAAFVEGAKESIRSRLAPDESLLAQLAHLAPAHSAFGRLTARHPDKLANISPQNLQVFLRQNYVVRRMRLILMGPASLDQLKSTARRWSKIRNGPRRRPPAFGPLLDGTLLPATIRGAASNPETRLSLIFETPSAPKLWESKSYQLLADHLTDPADSSLGSHLRQKNLITDLKVKFWSIEESGIFRVDLDLTPKGQTAPESVVSEVLTHLDELRTANLPESVFTQFAATQKERYLKRGRRAGLEGAGALAELMLDYPGMTGEAREIVAPDPNPVAFRQFLTHLTRKNLVVLVGEGS